MAPARELSVDRIIQLLHDGNPTQSVARDVGCSHSAVCKNGERVQAKQEGYEGKHTGRWKMSKHQDRKLKAMCFENQKLHNKRNVKQMGRNRSRCL